MSSASPFHDLLRLSPSNIIPAYPPGSFLSQAETWLSEYDTTQMYRTPDELFIVYETKPSTPHIAIITADGMMKKIMMTDALYVKKGARLPRAELTKCSDLRTISLRQRTDLSK